ncbi:MAG: hypothetical protein ACXVHR_04580, partial [Methanobacterium sp.]
HYKHEIPPITTDQKKIKQNIINSYLINFLFSLQKEKNSYVDGGEKGKKDFLDEFNKNNCLNFYQDGYRLGYQQGYDEVLKKIKKFKK